MTAAKGVLQTCSTVVSMVQAKNILDIGLFTGVSALTWATIIPEDGKVITMDVEQESYNDIGRAIIEKVGKGTLYRFWGYQCQYLAYIYLL